MGPHLIDYIVHKYGLQYYWWFQPAVYVVGIVSAVLWVKLQAYADRVRREHEERFPPPQRDSWL